MKYLIFIIFLISVDSCISHEKLRVNEKGTTFTEFPESDTLRFSPIFNGVLGKLRYILKHRDYLILSKINYEKSKWIVIYSLKEKCIIKELINYGRGPDEMLSCSIGKFDDKIWLQDKIKSEIFIIPLDSFMLDGLSNTKKHKVNMWSYSTALVNDSIMLGTNTFINAYKISYSNLENGNNWGKGSYSALSQNIPLGSLIDACSCYINVQPNSGKIALSYRYTDLLEIYDINGNLIHAIHGPNNFDVEFNAVSKNGHDIMAKNRRTIKAFVSSFVTNEHIYLLFSGRKRNEAEWPYGRNIFVYSWDGEPQKSLYIDFPIYSFCVDNSEQIVYSYSMTTGELIKAKL